MRLTFYGAAGMVTGSNYMLESGSTKILIDCGLRQGSQFCERQNFDPFPYDPKDIAMVFVTHAHIDHIGLLPRLKNGGFSGTIYSTPPTQDLSEFLLLDSEHILLEEATHMKLPPLYDIRAVEETMARWKGVRYHEPVTVGPFTATFYDAGHILGSSFVVVEAEDQRIIFSGDLGNSPAPIIGVRENYEGKADYCLVESTYGDRLHEAMEHCHETLEDVIEDTVKAKGVLMIPAFAMERTQDLLYELNNLKKQERIPEVPVFLDSPLAIKLTDVYTRFTDYFNEEARRRITSGDAIFNFPLLKKTRTTDESKAINDVPAPKVIIAGAGMSNGGRILHHERRYLSDPQSTILFIGYQAEGSLGRQIQDGAKMVKIFGEEVPVRCRVRVMSGFSAHADQAQLLDWLRPMRFSLKKLFVVQGEEDVSKVFSQKIKDDLAISAHVPSVGESLNL